MALVLWILQDVEKKGRLTSLYVDIYYNFEIPNIKEVDIKKNLFESYRYTILRNLLVKEKDRVGSFLSFSVFNEYAHNWLCQMRYNLRPIAIFGFSDGENWRDSGQNFCLLSDV